MEHRWGTRIPVNVPVRISSAALAGSGTLRDLSVSGAYIETSLPLSASAWVRIQVRRRRQATLQLSGFIIRHDGRGIGIEWLDIAPLDLAPSLAAVTLGEVIVDPDWPAASSTQRPHLSACS
jgi:hypothetical protein